MRSINAGYNLNVFIVCNIICSGYLDYKIIMKTSGPNELSYMRRMVVDNWLTPWKEDLFVHHCPADMKPDMEMQVEYFTDEIIFLLDTVCKLGAATRPTSRFTLSIALPAFTTCYSHLSVV